MSPLHRPLCPYFLRNACFYGDKCKNSHSKPEYPPSESPSPSLGNMGSPVCYHFLRGHCRFGDQCREYHPASDVNIEAAATKPPCRYFTRGSCTKGRYCPFTHQSGSGDTMASTVPVAEINNRLVVECDTATESSVQSADRFIYNCSISFGAGAEVLSVVTPFESRRVLISNIPTTVSDDEIAGAISHFPSTTEVQIHKSALTALATATLIFHDAKAAAQAVSFVNGTSIARGYRSLDLRPQSAAEEGTGVVRGRKIKLTWYGRRASAFVHYLSARSAEEHAQQLNGTAYRGYTLSASFRRPATVPIIRYRNRPGPTTAQLFTVMIRNLPLDTSKVHLSRFCGAESVAIDLPRCPADAPTQMQRVLERFGAVETFDVLPATKVTAKITAFAQLQSAEAAGAAETALRATPPKFLGGTPFFIERTFSVKYSIRQILFAKVKGPLDLLARINPTMIRYYLSENLHEPAILVLHGSEPKALGKMKMEVDRIVQGELLIVDGQKFWDETFEGTEGQIFLDSLNEGESVFIRCDSRTRTIRMFGSEQDRVQARETILDKLAELRLRRHVFPLRKDLIRVLLRGQLRRLQDTLGATSLVIDVVARTLTVHGEDSNVRLVRAELAALESGNPPDVDPIQVSTDAMCPVCFCSIDDLVRLEDCGHMYCRDCLQHYLRPASQDSGFTPRKCLAEVPFPEKPTSTIACGRGIAYSTIRSLLTSAEEDLLLRASFLAHVNEHPTDLRYCPSPDCEMVYRPSGMGAAFQCPSCIIQICPACNVEYHEGFSCAEHQDSLNGGLEALARWREKNGVKQCPNCHADIEKAGGCNHMTCSLCKTHICWVCMKTFSNSGSDGGIYPHMQREHGGHTTYQ
ncbi:hypothetical protein B0H15DRAFT_910927 [Mycena belliarum]|uniref:RBR-type E3 ubiquitin transferase n=1 Tax=Mycena belliarum TaxID=1033014 RepID=A0AAD6U0J9_9AGAR|nr:hypothetical protein B0H15DRAFT_910927 [Mycena belliae]